MKYHYVYLLIDTVPEDSRQFYIGVRSCEGSPENDSYMGSSKSMTSEQKLRCDKIILEEFKSREEAVSYEIYLHNKFDVAINEKFYNNSKQTSTGFDTTGRQFTFTEKHKHNMKLSHVTRSPDSYGKGWSHTEEAKQAIAKSKLGIPRSEETKHKLSENMKKLYETGYIHPKTGIKMSDQQKRQISATRKQKEAGKGIKNPRFSPWFIQHPNGTIEKFYDVTKEDKALLDGLPKDTYQVLATTLKGKRAAKKGKFKGYIVGNLSVDDIV